MEKLNKVSIKKNENPLVVMHNILSSVFPQGEIKFRKVNITDFVKDDSLRSKFSEHPAYVHRNDKRYAAEYLMDSTTFEKQDLILTTSLLGFNITGKFTFMGEVSRFYIPAGLVYSIINNRIETSIPKDVINLIAIIDNPAVVVFDMDGGGEYMGVDKKFYIGSLTYLFKESGKYLVVAPFNGFDYNTPQAKSTALRFFEFFLNLTQFFNENKKVTPFCYEILKPKLLTRPLIEKFLGRYYSDPAHEHSLGVVGAVNVAVNEYIINKVNEAYSKARNSFNFLGQDPIEALENFIELLKVLG